jgi:hypothetical protein
MVHEDLLGLKLVQRRLAMLKLKLLRYEALNRCLTRQQRPNSFMDTLAFSLQ